MGNYILSCDWGTSSFRLRLVQLISSAVIAETSVGDGIAAVHALWQATGQPPSERLNFFRTVLQAAISSLDNKLVNDSPVYLSGMASSSIGMKTLAYGTLPFDLSHNILPHEKIPADNVCRHDIYLFSGLQSGVDVMRGEETMLLGSHFENHKECLVIFPGTHSKHVWVRENILVNFSTYMTGEFFDLLANKSVLSASLQSSQVNGNENIFLQAVTDSIKGNLLNTVFHVRTNQLFNIMTPAENFQYLSGLVIGAELNGIPRAMANIILISGASLTSSYLLALNSLGFGDRVQCLNADQALINGHLKLAG